MSLNLPPNNQPRDGGPENWNLNETTFFSSGFDVVKGMLEDARLSLEGSLSSFFLDIEIPDSRLAQLEIEAAARIDHPRIILTEKAMTGGPNIIDPIAFGAAYPSGGVFSSTGGLTIVLTDKGLRIFGRLNDSRCVFHPISTPDDFSFKKFIPLMAKAGITPGSIERELRRVAQKELEYRGKFSMSPDFRKEEIGVAGCVSASVLQSLRAPDRGSSRGALISKPVSSLAQSLPLITRIGPSAQSSQEIGADLIMPRESTLLDQILTRLIYSGGIFFSVAFFSMKEISIDRWALGTAILFLVWNVAALLSNKRTSNL